MKKTIIISFVCLAVAMFAGYNVYLSNVKTKGLSDLALENVEALASAEPGAVKCGTRTENINTKTACSMDNLYSQGFVGIEYSQLSNGTDYTYYLRDEGISNFVAKVSPFNQVREKVRQIQREFAANNDCIMEGRDIGTVVLPKAQCKLFITASSEVRAQRRFEQLKQTPDCPTYEEILEEINERDFKDINREHGALLPAEDGIIIDNSNETVEQTIERCKKIILEKWHK